MTYTDFAAMICLTSKLEFSWGVLHQLSNMQSCFAPAIEEKKKRVSGSIQKKNKRKGKKKKEQEEEVKKPLNQWIWIKKCPKKIKKISKPKNLIEKQNPFIS